MDKFRRELQIIFNNVPRYMGEDLEQRARVVLPTVYSQIVLDSQRVAQCPSEISDTAVGCVLYKTRSDLGMAQAFAAICQKLELAASVESCLFQQRPKYFVLVDINGQKFVCDPFLERVTQNVPHFKHFMMNRLTVEKMNNERYAAMDSSQLSEQEMDYFHINGLRLDSLENLHKLAANIVKVNHSVAIAVDYQLETQMKEVGERLKPLVLEISQNLLQMTSYQFTNNVLFC